jgi:hypothetical protein
MRFVYWFGPNRAKASKAWGGAQLDRISADLGATLGAGNCSPKIRGAWVFRGLVSDDQYLVSDGDTVKAIPTSITEPDRDRKSAINGRDQRDALYRAILPFAIS